MREPKDIIINGRTLAEILDDHKLWMKEPAGEETHQFADLRNANLIGADLRGADLIGADLRGADLIGANIDYSSWPLWCGSNHVKVDQKIAAQLAAHFCALDCDDPEYQVARAAILEFAKTSHRAKDLGLK
jgi:hypothetical protein